MAISYSGILTVDQVLGPSAPKSMRVSSGAPNPARRELGPLEEAVFRLVRHAVREAVGRLGWEIGQIVRREVKEALATQPAADAASLDGWVSPRQAAKLTSVGYETVLGWIAEGKLAAQRVGRQFRIKRSDLELFMSTPREEVRTGQADIDREVARILGTHR